MKFGQMHQRGNGSITWLLPMFDIEVLSLYIRLGQRKGFFLLLWLRIVYIDTVLFSLNVSAPFVILSVSLCYPHYVISCVIYLYFSAPHGLLDQEVWLWTCSTCVEITFSSLSTFAAGSSVWNRWYILCVHQVHERRHQRNYRLEYHSSVCKCQRANSNTLVSNQFRHWDAVCPHDFSLSLHELVPFQSDVG